MPRGCAARRCVPTAPSAGPGIGSAPGDAAPRLSPETFRTNLQALVLVARYQGRAIIFVDWHPLGDTAARYGAIQHEVGAALEVPVVTYAGPRVPDDPVHPTAVGYAAMAAELAPVVLAVTPRR